jgi:hypothetical protein
MDMHFDERLVALSSSPRLFARVLICVYARLSVRRYGIEDKYMFLEEARMLGLPCTPMLHDNFVVVKHRNEEGGLGYKSFSNAAGGGEWIIQPGLRNSKKIAQMLPLNAPLSTLRIVSSCAGGGAGGSLVACVWRAGRAGAATDHKSVLFDVDSTTGEVGCV